MGIAETAKCKKCGEEVYVWFVVANGYCPKCGSTKGIKEVRRGQRVARKPKEKPG